MSSLKLEKVNGNKYLFSREPEAVSSNGDSYMLDSFKDALEFSITPPRWMDEIRRKRGRPKKYKLDFKRLTWPLVHRKKGRHNHRDALGQFAKAPRLSEVLLSTYIARQPMPDWFKQAYMCVIPAASVMHDRAYDDIKQVSRPPGHKGNMTIVDEVEDWMPPLKFKET